MRKIAVGEIAKRIEEIRTSDGRGGFYVRAYAGFNL